MQFRRLTPAAGLVGFVATGGCGSGGSPVDASDAPLPGTLTAAWSITDLDHQPIDCAQVAASTVVLQLQGNEGALGAPVSLSCATSPSTSPPLAPGTYDIGFELHSLNVTLATATPQNSVVIVPGRDTQLAPVAFVVDARGALVLALATSLASNCKSTGMMGAGITGTTITLEQAGGGCAAATFAIARGETPLGTYTVNCSSPQVAACLETDETLSVSPIPSGAYTIHVRGKAGAVDCWKNDDSLQVPPLGASLTETLNLARTGNPGC